MISERDHRQCCWPQYAGTDEDVVTPRRRRRLLAPKARLDRLLAMLADDSEAKARTLADYPWQTVFQAAVRLRPHVRPPKPHGSDRQARFWWQDIDLDEPTPIAAPGRRRSLHPGKLTQTERASFRALPRGWDADRPIRRADCEGDRECPWCGQAVAMRISYSTHPGTIRCPECREYVAYRAPRAGKPWGWQRFSLRHPHLGDPDRLPMAARNRCRPCWMARCRKHLYLEVKLCGSIKLNHPRVPPERMDLLVDTCASDVADRVEVEGVGKDPKVLPLELVGAKLGLTLERARQLEAQALQEVHVRNMRNNSGVV